LYGNVFNYQASKELNGITGLSLVQNFNLFTIVNLFDPKLPSKLFVVLVFLGFAALFGLDYLIYIKNGRYNKVNSAFENENDTKLIFSIVLVTLYFICSGFLFIITGPAYSS
jgi:hypothetical protein